MNKNHPSKFWQISENSFSEEDWENAYFKAVEEDFDFKGSLQDFIDWVLMEKQFGPDHWHLSHIRRLFYMFKPFIPRLIQIFLRQAYEPSQKKNHTLYWPIEERYVNFKKKLIRYLLENKNISEVPYIRFWPKGKDFAFVLTHDVETEEGFNAITKVVELEKKHGFRSVFNIVPERYKIDTNRLDKLKADGFEVGIHGLKHDGKLFLSKETFLNRITTINEYIKDWGVEGFRSPQTHRNIQWMNELECHYDMSFFDTDPYEPISGGTMSIWPFFLCHFIEMPYTLPQDSTLFMIKKETDINIWKDKINFIEKKKGMVLLNIHSDYLDFENKWGKSRYPVQLFEELLDYINSKKNYWHALPKDVAKWWESRAKSALKEINGEFKITPHLNGAEVGTMRLEKSELLFD